MVRPSEGKERKEFINNKLKPRLEKVLGISKLRDVIIRRYRFNFACQSQDNYLGGKYVYHQNGSNPTATERIPSDLKGKYDNWLLTTDDRPLNLLFLTPKEHKQKHEKLKNTRFLFTKTNK